MERNYKRLTQEEREDIFKLFKNNSIKSLAKMYGTSRTHMTNIYSECLARIKYQASERERFPECRYWDTEEEIIQSMELNYSPEHLEGWELEQFNKL